MNENRILGVALVVLAAVAAWSSFRGEVSVGGPEPLTTLQAGRVKNFRYYSTTSTVVAERRGEHWWMEVDRKATSESFVANQQFEKALDAMTPMRPLRSLGVMDLARRRDFELEPPRIVLEFEGPSGEERVQVGDRTQVGQKDGYARRPGGEEVFIVDLAEIDKFNNAFGFRRRRLRNQGLGEVASAVVQWSDGEVRARQRNRDDAKNRFWASEAQPDEKDEALTELLEVLERLRIRAYPDPEPELDAEEAWLTVRWVDAKDQPLDTLHVWRVDSPEGTEWFARSNASVRTVGVADSKARKLAAAVERLTPDP